MQVTGATSTIKWYDLNALRYSSTVANTPSIADIEKFSSHLQKGDSVLDVGCAAGRDTNILSKKGFNAIGIDISQGLIEIAKKAYPHLNFVRGDFLNLPFSSNSFDGVWAHAAIVHLETESDVKRAISEFHRVLKSQGLLFIKVKEQTGENKTEIVIDKLSNSERFFRYYKEEELVNYLEESGFELTSVERDKDRLGRSELSWLITFSRKN